MTRPPRRLAAALACLALLAGCSDDEPAAEQPPEDEAPTEQVVVNPLTGEELPEAPGHPVLTVKIDNSSSSAPQVGLGQADLVVEELVEGGITRLAVSFYSAVPRTAGPVRSMRATDIGVVQPLAGVLVTSGGAPPTRKRVDQAGIAVVAEDGPGFYRDSGRSAPYNLMVRLKELAAEQDAKEAPEVYLPFDAEGTLPRGGKARGLTATLSPSRQSTFRYAKGGYTLTNGYAADGDGFTADTVLVLRVRVTDAGYKDPAGNPVPETRFTGTGPAQVFHGGRVVKATWVKDGFDAPIGLRAGGKDLTLPAGKVWIELVPRTGGAVSVTR